MPLDGGLDYDAGHLGGGLDDDTEQLDNARHLNATQYLDDTPKLIVLPTLLTQKLICLFSTLD